VNEAGVRRNVGSINGGRKGKSQLIVPRTYNRVKRVKNQFCSLGRGGEEEVEEVRSASTKQKLEDSRRIVKDGMVRGGKENIRGKKLLRGKKGTKNKKQNGRGKRNHDFIMQVGGGKRIGVRFGDMGGRKGN